MSVTDKEVAGAKNALLAAAYDRSSCRHTNVQDMGAQALFAKDVIAPSKVNDLINGITLGDVQVPC